jgi:hypothetical protein
MNSTASEERVSSYSIFDFQPLLGYKSSSLIPSTTVGTLKLKCLKLYVYTLSNFPLLMASSIFYES